MKQYCEHDIVAGAVTWEFDRVKKLLLLRRPENDKYLPGEWYILTEHIKKGESKKDALKRGLKIETRLDLERIANESPELELRYMDYPDDIFRITIYECSPKTVPKEGLIALNHENIDYDWHDLRNPLYDNPKLNESRIIDITHAHLKLIELMK